MTRRWIDRLTVTVAVSVLSVASSYAQGGALKPDQVASIEREVTAALQNYYRLYSEKNNAALGAGVFFEPWIQLGGRGPQLQHTAPDEIAKRFADSVAGLEAQGWVKSEYPNPIVCVINSSTAIASGEFKRYRKDGSVLSVNGTTYLFGRTPEGWRIVSYFGHEVGKVIGCNDGM